MKTRGSKQGRRRDAGFRRGSSAAGDAGFTVARLLVSFSILATMLATAAPNFYRTLQAYTIRGAAMQLYADLQNAREKAVMENNRHRLSVTGAYTYELRDDRDRDRNFGDDEVVASSDLTNDTPGVSLAASGDVIFTASGTAVDPVTITLTDVRGGVLTISISPAGRIRLL